MARLISADKLRKDVLDLPNCYNGFSDTYDKAMIVDLVDEQPTIEAEPIRHGRWKGKPIAGYSTVKCSECGYVFMENSGKWNYCPNCGAKMDEVKI